jgi:predicted ATP-grasp superfamily ATP-dependent carboligase
MEELRVGSRPELRRPVLITAFRGWNDGGQGASLAGGFLARTWKAARFADIDPEEFFDFQATRPHVSLVDGVTRQIDWPDNAFYHAPIPGTDRDALLLLGIEPNVRWRTFTNLVTQLASELGVELVVTLGSLLADVPHTRPSPVTGSASDAELVTKLGLQASRYEGPTGIVGVLHDSCKQSGLPSASLWASVPHYVAAAPNPKVALALVRAFEGAAGLAVDAGELEEAAEDYERQVSAAVASDPEVKAFVERLESAMDEVQADEPSEESLPSADSIARDFQRFLRQRGPES